MSGKIIVKQRGDSALVTALHIAVMQTVEGKNSYSWQCAATRTGYQPNRKLVLSVKCHKQSSCYTAKFMNMPKNRKKMKLYQV